jgi:hypothetical protein
MLSRSELVEFDLLLLLGTLNVLYGFQLGRK